MRLSKTALKELTAAYRAVLRHGILCNAIALGLAVATPAMADPVSPVNTTGNAWVFGDVAFSDQHVAAGQAAFGGRREAVSTVEGKYHNVFPQYNMVGQSFSLGGSDAYFGPMNITLRTLNDEGENKDNFAFNWQAPDGNGGVVDMDIAGAAGIGWAETPESVIEKLTDAMTTIFTPFYDTSTEEGLAALNAAVTEAVNGAWKPVYAMSRKGDGSNAGNMAFDNVDAVIDGATVNAKNISVTNGSDLTFVKQDATLLNTSSTFYTLAGDIDSDGITTLNATNSITTSNSDVLVDSGASLVMNANDITLDGNGKALRVQGVSATLDSTNITVTSDNVGVRADDGAELNIGKTGATVNITGTADDAVESIGGGAEVNIVGNKVNLRTNATGVAATIWAQDGDVDVYASEIDMQSKQRGIQAIADETSSVVTIGDNTTSKITIDADEEGVWAFNGARVDLTGDTLDLSSKNSNTVIAQQNGAQINITGTNVDIATANADWAAVHAGNNTLDSTGALATVNINADTINIKSEDNEENAIGHAIAAMSQGIVNITGNTTVKGENAILTRGNAVTNINTTENNNYKTVLNGDVNFNFDKPSSNTPIDAVVNLNLNTADSSWTGNTYASWNELPSSEQLAANYLDVSGMHLNLKNGATWTATGTRAETAADAATDGMIYTAMNNLNVNNGTVNVQRAGGIEVENLTVGENGLTINDGTMTVSNSLTSTGRTVVADDATLTLNATNGANFTGITSALEGGAIYTAGNANISNANFTDNTTAQDGGALKIAIADTTSKVVVEDSTFTGNKAISYAQADSGAISLSSGTLEIKGDIDFDQSTSTTIFSNNQAKTGGAIYAYKGDKTNTSYAKLDIDGVVFDHNVSNGTNDANSGGGAIGNVAKNFRNEGNAGMWIKNSIFSNNRDEAVNRNGGGAIFAGSDSRNNIQNTVFVGNSSLSAGGAIGTRDFGQGENHNAKMDIVSSSFANNTADTNGGAINNYLYGSDTMAGSVYVYDTTFTENEAAKGGAIYNHRGQIGDNLINASVNGKQTATSDASLIQTGNMYIADSDFTGNSASDKGGAIFNEGELTIAANAADVSFSGNTAAGNANDIYNVGTLNLTAASGRTISLAGGVDGTDGTLNINGAGTVETSTIKNQTVALSNGELHLTNSDLTGSTVAVASGATINTIDGSIDDYMSTITLANGANIKGDIDFTAGTADKYLSTGAAAVNYKLGNLVGAVGSGVKNIQVASDGTTVNKDASFAWFNSADGLTVESSGNADGMLTLTGLAGGIAQAADVSANVSEVEYNVTADESLTEQKSLQHSVTLNGDGTDASGKELELAGVDLTAADGATVEINDLKLTGTGTYNNAATAVTSIRNSLIDVQFRNAGILYSDPTTYSDTLINTGIANIAGDTFASTGVLQNYGTANLSQDGSDKVTFESGATITGSGVTNLVSGQTIFNNTLNENTVKVASGADFDGALSGGTLDLHNGAINTITGSFGGGDVVLDAKFAATGTATNSQVDTLGGNTGTIKEINVLGTAYGDADSVTLATGGTLDSNVQINGMNYYTNVTDNGDGTVTFSDKLINTSTIRGIGNGTSTFVGDVVVGDKAGTTTIGAKDAKIALNNTGATATVTAANGLIVTDGTNSATLTAKSTGLDMAEGLTVGGTAYGINSTGVAKLNGLTVGTTSYGITNAGAGSLASLTVGGNDVLTTDSTLNGAKLDAGTVAKTALASGVQTSLGLADSALQAADITTGSANGTIAVKGADVAVKGLGTAAYKADSYFQTALSDTNKLNTDYIDWSDAQTAALGSGITAAKVNGYDSVVSAVNDASTGLAATYGLASTAVQQANIATSLTSSSTDAQVASAKAVYDGLAGKQDTLTAGNGVSLTGTTIAAKAGNSTITVDTDGIKVGTIDTANIADGAITLAKINASAIQGATDTTTYSNGLLATAGYVDEGLALKVNSANLADKSLTINAAALRVNDNDVLTTANLAGAYTGGSLAAANAYVTGENATKLANVGTTAALITDLFNDKQGWISGEFGVDTTLTDAHTILVGAGYTDQTSDGKVGLVDAILANKNSIETLDEIAAGDSDNGTHVAVADDGGEIATVATDASSNVTLAKLTTKDDGSVKMHSKYNTAEAYVRTSVNDGGDPDATAVDINATNIRLTGNTTINGTLTAGATTVNSLTIGTTGYGISSTGAGSLASLTVGGNNVLTTADVAPAYTGSSLADAVTYVGTYGTELATVGTTAALVTDLFNDKQTWMSEELGYDTATTDAGTILAAAGYTDETGEGDIGIVDAVLQNQAAIAAVDGRVDDVLNGTETFTDLNINGTHVTGVTTSTGLAALLADPTTASDSNLITEKAVVDGLTTLIAEKETWIGNELGIDTTTTDAHTILAAAGYTDQTGEGSVGVVDAVLENQAAIGDRTYTGANYITTGESVTDSLIALDTELATKVDLDDNNTFTGTNTFQNDAGITIKDTAGTNTAQLTATTDGLNVGTGMKVNGDLKVSDGANTSTMTASAVTTKTVNTDNLQLGGNTMTGIATSSSFNLVTPSDSLLVSEAAVVAGLNTAVNTSVGMANAYTDQRVEKLDKNLSSGIASAIALTSVSTSGVQKGEVAVSGGYGYYNGQSAAAFGAAMGLSNRWSVNAGAGVSNADVSFRAGTTYKFKMF